MKKRYKFKRKRRIFMEKKRRGSQTEGEREREIFDRGMSEEID